MSYPDGGVCELSVDQMNDELRLCLTLNGFQIVCVVLCVYVLVCVSQPVAPHQRRELRCAVQYIYTDNSNEKQSEGMYEHN